MVSNYEPVIDFDDSRTVDGGLQNPSDMSGTNTSNSVDISLSTQVNIHLLSEFNNMYQEDEYLAETMHVDVFAATFYAMRTKYKKQYKLLNEDQAGYFFECMFILAIQIILFVCLESKALEVHLKYENEFFLQLCLFFCTFVMHTYILATIRNGIQICKYVLYH
jgi:hypothetical protein